MYFSIFFLDAYNLTRKVVSKSGNPCPVYQAGWSGRQMFRTDKIAKAINAILVKDKRSGQQYVVKTILISKVIFKETFIEYKVTKIYSHL
jgi:hypothetical protein